MNIPKPQIPSLILKSPSSRHLSSRDCNTSTPLQSYYIGEPQSKPKTPKNPNAMQTIRIASPHAPFRPASKSPETLKSVIQTPLSPQNKHSLPLISSPKSLFNISISPSPKTQGAKSMQLELFRNITAPNKAPKLLQLSDRAERSVDISIQPKNVHTGSFTTRNADSQNNEKWPIMMNLVTKPRNNNKAVPYQNVYKKVCLQSLEQSKQQTKRVAVLKKPKTHAVIPEMTSEPESSYTGSSQNETESEIMWKPGQRFLDLLDQTKSGISEKRKFDMQEEKFMEVKEVKEVMEIKEMESRARKGNIVDCDFSVIEKRKSVRNVSKGSPKTARYAQQKEGIRKKNLAELLMDLESLDYSKAY